MTGFISNSPWVVFPKTTTGRPRLFCFPYSGAGASVFFPWVGLLSNTCDVCAVQYPGRGTRLSEPLLTDLKVLVSGTVQGLLPFFQQPFAFFGHSLGALVAFELTRALRRDFGLQPLHLFVSGHHAPHLNYVSPLMYDLSDQEFIERLKKLNGMSPEFWESEELVNMMLPILRADFTACETYTFNSEEPLDCPVTALGGLADADVPRTSLEAWQEHTRGAFFVRMFPGDHFYLNDQRFPLVQSLARDLEASQRLHR